MYWIPAIWSRKYGRSCLFGEAGKLGHVVQANIDDPGNASSAEGFKEVMGRLLSKAYSIEFHALS